MKRVKLDVKDIDPKNKERATVVLLTFRHPLLKLEKKFKVSVNPPGHNFRIVHFKSMRAAFRLGLT